MTCTHLGRIKTVAPKTDGCEECLKIGQEWVHLRVCRECGHVGCCDDSIGQHATKHFEAAGHPIMECYYPSDAWGWCYVDEEMFDFTGHQTPHPDGWSW
jgi:hypothetical protein